jgi:hypothetical protein
MNAIPTSIPLTRRNVLRRFAAFGFGLPIMGGVLAACGPQAQAPAATTAPAPAPTTAPAATSASPKPAASTAPTTAAPTTAAAAPTAAATAAAAKQYSLDFANVLESGELFVQLGNGIEDASKVAGLKLKRYNNNLDGPTAINNARLMVQDQPDLILEWLKPKAGRRQIQPS